MERLRYLNITGRVMTRRVIVLAAAVGVTGEYLVQRKGIVEAPELEWGNFLQNPVDPSLTDRIAGGVRRELEIVKRVDKAGLAMGAATRVVKQVVGISFK